MKKVIFLILVSFSFVLFSMAKERNEKESVYWFKYPITKVVRVYDGDTFWVDFDMGFNIKKTNEKIRVLGCDTYEMRDEKGSESKKFTEDFLSTGTLILWSNGERDNFGRILATVDRDGIFLHDALTSAGLTTGRFELRINR